MTVLKFDPPGPDAPGFLRRQKKVLEFQRSIEHLEPETIDSLVAFLVDFVTEPEDRDEAREALWDASQNQFMAMLEALSSENPTEPAGES